jgi:hypothetical protein
MVRSGTLDEVADHGTFGKRGLRRAWKMLGLPERIDQVDAVAVTIVAALLASGMQEEDEDGARRISRFVHEAWAHDQPGPDAYLLWRDGNAMLHTGEPYDIDLPGIGATQVFELRQWATGE